MQAYLAQIQFNSLDLFQDPFNFTIATYYWLGDRKIFFYQELRLKNNLNQTIPILFKVAAGEEVNK
ncbi:MAG: hypothetical protein QNJ38_02615 [Prochloraceae cyanobacterium]|nr:hypothetical protein [Prochloraceae cyanobacterium]